MIARHSFRGYFGVSMTACAEALVLVAVQRIWPESLTPAASVMVKPELEGIRINQHAVTVDEADMLAG